MEDLVAMARAAEKDERLSDGALYGKLADEIERLRAALLIALPLVRAAATQEARANLAPVGFTRTRWKAGLAQVEAAIAPTLPPHKGE